MRVKKMVERAERELSRRRAVLKAQADAILRNAGHGSLVDLVERKRAELGDPEVFLARRRRR